MGGSKSHTEVKTEYKERPLTEEEKQLLREEARFARLLGQTAMSSESRSQDIYKRYLDVFAPLEDSMVARVLLTNKELGTVDKDLLSRFQAQAKSSVYSGAKGADKKLKQFFAQRGMEGSGLEAKALSNMYAGVSQAAAGALQDAFFKALQQSDIYRQQKLQNVASAISVGKGLGQGAFQYQGLAGQQYQGASNAFGQTFRDWDMRWKQSSFQNSSSSSGPLSSLGNLFSITKAI